MSNNIIIEVVQGFERFGAPTSMVRVTHNGTLVETPWLLGSDTAKKCARDMSRTFKETAPDIPQTWIGFTGTYDF